VNGQLKPRGTPYREELPAGRYRVRLVNDDLDRHEDFTVIVEPHAVKTIERNW